MYTARVPIKALETTTRKPELSVCALGIPYRLSGRLFMGIAPVFSSGIVNLDKDEQPRSKQYQQSEKDIEVCH